MEIKNIKISELKPAEYNPRKLTAKQADDIKQSLINFGLVDPIIVNSNPERKNIVIGGHQRLKIWAELGNNEIPVNYVDLLPEKEKELNIRLNKNFGEWDFDILQSFFDKADLENWGFEEIEIFPVEGDENEKLEEIEQQINAYKKTHVLISAKPEVFAKIGEYIEFISKIDGVEIEQSSN